MGRRAARAVNHVLRGSSLALERLRPHAGRVVHVSMGPFERAFAIQTTGEVAAAPATAPHDLEVRLSPLLVARLAVRDPAAFAAIEMSGDPALAAEVDYLARNLRWDVEEDLSRLVGDIAAHRVVGAVSGAARVGREAALRAAQGAAEYWTEEAPLIASRVRLESFARETSELAAAVDRLSERVERVAERLDAAPRTRN